MSHFSRRDVAYTYSALNNESTPPLGRADPANAAPTLISLDHEHEDANNVIIHEVPKNKGGWTHIEDLDSFFTRMYRYYVRGGFYPMIFSDLFCLLQFIFIIWFSTFLIHCVNYPRLFRRDASANRSEKLTIDDVVYSSSVCVDNISWKWWSLIALCSIIWFMRLCLSIYHLYYAYDTKLFYKNALKIQESDLAWINWSTIQDRVREAQPEHHMCVHKQEINEINNYMVAMVNKNLLPLQIHIPLAGDFHYLSRGLKWNLEFLLFCDPWENCWQLREAYKDHSKRMVLARQLERQILLLALFNLLFAPFIQAWQILYFFFNYAEHELRDRLTRAHKPATKYLNSFTSPITTVFARNIVFLSGSVLGVLVMLSVYDEDVLTVEHERGGCAGPARGEELFVQVLGHVHYLPAAWRGRAHTKDVAAHFQQLFQFRAVYIIFELLSPLLCPLVLLSLRARALDIVDFYRNFTVSVLGIGDVCSFAQNKTMLGSYIQQSLFGAMTPMPAEMDETSDEDDEPPADSKPHSGSHSSAQPEPSLAGAGSMLSASVLGVPAQAARCLDADD
ncbi:putative APG9 autophagy 9-like 1, partial [Operophtera brumata]